MKAQNKNFLYNALYQIFIFIIPMVTIPYISRVLGVDNIGVYSYTYSIVNYFMLLSLLGITNYGSREIAKCKSIEETSKKFKSIYLLQLSLNIISILLYAILILVMNYEYKNIMIIQTIFLISVAFDINWFFFGKEKFKITVTRNMIIKILSLILIFILVKKESDLWIYTLIMSVATLISQMYLWLFIKKEIVKVSVSFKDVLSNLKPCLVLFIPIIAYSIYRIMDKTMIGSIADTVELGNYESAEKVISIPVSIVTALGTVMMPYMSKKNQEEIGKEIYKTFELSLFMILPMIIVLAVIANDFSLLFFGDGYEKAGTIIQIIIITVLFACIANTIRTNYLIPCKKDRIYVTSTVLGAVANLISNFLLIGRYGAYGACVGTILAEFLVMFYQIVCTTKIIDYKKVLSIGFGYLLKSIIIGVIVFLVGLFINKILLKIIIQLFIAVIIYLLLNINYVKYDFLGMKKKNN